MKNKKKNKLHILFVTETHKCIFVCIRPHRETERLRRRQTEAFRATNRNFNKLNLLYFSLSPAIYKHILYPSVSQTRQVTSTSSISSQEQHRIATCISSSPLSLSHSLSSRLPCACCLMLSVLHYVLQLFLVLFCLVFLVVSKSSLFLRHKYTSLPNGAFGI